MKLDLRHAPRNAIRALRYTPRDGIRWVRSYAQGIATRHKAIEPGAEHALPGRLVVSLTSYPPRFRQLDLTLRCLLSQSVRADVVVLWVAHGHTKLLPPRVLALQEHGLTIRECDDTKSFKKIVPAFLEYPDAYIVIADDDTAYPYDWLESFVEEYWHDGQVLCMRARRFLTEVDGTPIPFMEWKGPNPKKSRLCGPSIVPIGSGGVMYPPGSLPLEAADAATFQKLCPEADDLWLYWMFSRAGRMARLIKARGRIGNWHGTQNVALWRRNDFDGGNDKQITALVSAFGLPWQAARMPRADDFAMASRFSGGRK